MTVKECLKGFTMKVTLKHGYSLIKILENESKLMTVKKNQNNFNIIKGYKMLKLSKHYHSRKKQIVLTVL